MSARTTVKKGWAASSKLKSEISLLFPKIQDQQPHKSMVTSQMIDDLSKQKHQKEREKK